MMSPHGRLRAILAAALALAAVRSAGAEWLVTKDGAKIEIQGAHRVDGKRVIFKQADGRLASLRADQIDLEATAKANQPPPETMVEEPVAVEPTRAKWSFSDKDFGHPEPTVDAKPEAGGKPVEAAGSDLSVLVWRQAIDPARNQVEISGTLQNGGKNMAAGVQLEVRLVDKGGKVLATQAATLTAAKLAPGESAEFRAGFPSVAPFDSVKFEPKAALYKVQSGEGAKTEATADGSTESTQPPDGR